MDIQEMLSSAVVQMREMRVAYEQAELKVNDAIRIIRGVEKSAQEGPGIKLDNLTIKSHEIVVSMLQNLTPKEREIFALLGQGLGTKEIGEKLKRSQKTVEAHRETMRRKLGFKTSAELAAEAKKHTL